MKLYKKLVKYVKWFENDRGNPTLVEETDWLDEEEAEKLGITEGPLGPYVSWDKYEDFVEVKQ